MKEIANKIALIIAHDIKTRSGLKDAFDAVSPTIRIEMMETWTTKIAGVLAENKKKFEGKTETTIKSTGAKK